MKQGIHSLSSVKLLVVLLASACLQLGAQTQDLEYIIIDGEITITGLRGAFPDYIHGRVVIPESIEGLPVTTIGDYAFESCPFSNVTIPRSVTTIGDYAFSHCYSLKRATFLGAPPTAGTGAFYRSYPGSYGGPLESFEIWYPYDVPGWDTAFPEYVKLPIFPDMSYALEPSGEIVITGYSGSGSEVIIPSTVAGYPVTTIGHKAFVRSALNGIHIPDSVTSIEASAFEECVNLTGVTIPDSVTVIGQFAFARSALNSIHIPDLVTSIKASAFEGCANLTSVTIPDSVVEIGHYAFADCSNLTEIQVSSGNQAYTSMDGVLFDKLMATLLQFPAGRGGDYVIPNAVTSIGDGAFKNCFGLLNVTFPETLASLGWGVFENCTGLTSVTLPPSLTTTGMSTFAGCSILSSVTLPDSITSIEYLSFAGCRSLAEMDIPDSVTLIGGAAFGGCISLSEIIIPDSVTLIGEAAFEGCNNLTSVTIPDSVGNLNSAFSDCDSLASITIGSGLSEGAELFDCPKLIEYLVSEDNPNFSGKDGVLYSKNGETLVRFPEGRGGGFVIPESVNVIGHYVFENSALTSISIPNSVTTIGVNAFTNCSNVISLIIPDSVTSFEENFWGYYAFNFRGCSSLISLKFPASVETIYQWHLSGCNSLTRIYFTGEPPELDWYWETKPFVDSPDELVIYYLEGTLGWETTFHGRPTAPFTPWGRYGTFDMDPYTYADTDSFLGMLEVSLDPWTWCDRTACWFNIPEQTAENGKGWMYAPAPGNLQIFPIDGTDMGYSFALEKWLYSTESGWVYVM